MEHQFIDGFSVNRGIYSLYYPFFAVAEVEAFNTLIVY